MHPEQPPPFQRNIEAENSAYRRIVQTVSSVGLRRPLPTVVMALVDEPLAPQSRFLAHIQVTYVRGPEEQVGVLTGIAPDRAMAEFPKEKTMFVLRALAEPEVPLICEKDLAEEIAQESVTWIEEDHYRLQGMPKGVIEVYTPYRARMVQGDDPNITIFEQFLE